MLNNSKVVVVGGSSGIGHAIARQALDAGAEVVIASRSLERLHAAASQLGGRVSIEQIDATDEKSVIDFFRRIGPFDHLAATIKPHLPSGKFLDNDVTAASAAFDAKFWGQYRLAKHAARQIRANGSIVFTSGIASRRAYPGYSAVSAMNAATEALAHAIAVELSPIRVNTVCPGFVDADTPIAGRADYVRGLAPDLPLDRLGTTKEIADAYLYLFGNTYATGSVIVVDGGATCGAGGH